MTMVFDSDLPTTEKMVLLAMADYASDNGDSIFPSIETLSHKTSLSDRSVQTSIQNLINKNYLILLKKGGGRANTNLYKIRCSRFTVSEKGETDSLKGETGAQKGEGRSPDPSLTIINPPQSANAESEELQYSDCDDYGEPIKGKKQPKQKPCTKKLYPIAMALSEVTGMSLDSNKEKIFREAKYLVRDPRVTAEEIKMQFSPGGDWYKFDWRGKKGQRPILTQIRETIFTFSEIRPEPKGMAAVKAEMARLEAQDGNG